MKRRIAARLNGQQLDLDVPGIGAEVDHGTVAVHCRAGVDDLDTVNFHDAPGLVDVGAADKVERLHVLPDAVASHVLPGRFVEGLVGRGMAEEDVVDRLLHLFHRAVQHVIYLLVGQLERGVEGGRVGPADTNQGHFAQVHLE